MMCFPGHASSKTGAEPSGKVTLKSKTVASVTGEEQDRSHRKTYCEESSHDSRILLPLGNDCTVSDKVLLKTDSVNRSAEYSGDSQARKLQVDITQRLSLNDEGNRPQSVRGTPRQSSTLNNVGNPPKTENRHVKDKSFDPFAEGAEFTLPGKYRKRKATSAQLYSELRKIAVKDCGKPSPCHSRFVERLEAGFDVGDISTQNKFQDKQTDFLKNMKDCLHSPMPLLVEVIIWEMTSRGRTFTNATDTGKLCSVNSTSCQKGHNSY